MKLNTDILITFVNVNRISGQESFTGIIPVLKSGNFTFDYENTEHQDIDALA